MKPILDACCGGKMFYFDKNDPRVLFQDIRSFKNKDIYKGRTFWKEILTKGFAECFRVLAPGGFLIFKWNETDIKVSEILKLTPEKPVFGHISGKRANTHWICFLKNNN